MVAGTRQNPAKSGCAHATHRNPDMAFHLHQRTAENSPSRVCLPANWGTAALFAACLAVLVNGCDRRSQREPVSEPAYRPPSAESTRLPHEDLDAALWMRTSAEYRVLLLETWRRALAVVDAAIGDSDRNGEDGGAADAGTVTRKDSSNRPQAVILDIDETALDNMPYLVEMVLEEPYEFDLDRWNVWCTRAAAEALPGAVEFVQGCRERGVAVFFISNRGSGVRPATLENLRRAGLMPATGGDGELLLKGDRPEWGSDKTSRRELVASQFRVLAIVGDDLGDFVWSGLNATPDQRRQAALENMDHWGRDWFLLPNPDYGGWERAIEGYDSGIPRSEKLRRRWEVLEGMATGPDGS